MMGIKIYKNREVLQGIKFKAKLKSKLYDFKIFLVTNNEITISKSMNYDEINYASSDSFEGNIKRVILDNTADNDLPLSRRTFMSAIKLKKIPILFGGYKFNFKQITNSNVLVIFSIGLDELLESEENNFVGTIKNVVLDNLLDNPPRIRKPKSYSGYGFTSFLFDWDISVPVDLSEERIEKNRKKFKKQREEEKRKREKGEQLEKMLNLNKRLNTRELARFR